MSGTTSQAAAPHSEPSSETLGTVRNAFKLGGSLLISWGVALGIRVLLPRYLGPEVFGPFTFADAFTTLFFLPLGLGVETYVRKEVAVRPAHASDFFGGLLAARVALSALLFVAVFVVMHVTDRPPEVRRVVYVFGLAQLFVNHSNTLAALLQARSEVDGLSLTSIGAKVVWGAGVLGCILLGGGLTGIAVSFVVSEVLRAIVLSVLANRHLDLRLRIDVAATRLMLVASLPFFLNGLTVAAYGKIDVNVLTFLLDDAKEVGWYGAASGLAGLTLLLTPLIGWVLTPQLSRSLERSEAEFDGALRRSFELTLLVSIPVSLAISVGADVWVTLMFGEAYAPAAASLRLLAPVFTLTYVAILAATALVLLNRGWTLTKVSLVGLVANIILNLTLVPLGLRVLGPSGGGAGCAAAMVLTESLSVVLLMLTLGGRAFDRRSVTAVTKSLFACVVVVIADRLCAWLGKGRLGVDAVVYLALVLALGAIPVREVVQLLQRAWRHSDDVSARA